MRRQKVESQGGKTHDLEMSGVSQNIDNMMKAVTPHALPPPLVKVSLRTEMVPGLYGY